MWYTGGEYGKLAQLYRSHPIPRFYTKSPAKAKYPVWSHLQVPYYYVSSKGQIWSSARSDGIEMCPELNFKVQREIDDQIPQMDTISGYRELRVRIQE